MRVRHPTPDHEQFIIIIDIFKKWPKE